MTDEAPLTAGERAELKKLRLFKTTVHDCLDRMGIPAHPPGPHLDAGCRVHERLDYVADLLQHDSKPTLAEAMYWDVHDFQSQIIGFPFPDRPTVIAGERLDYSVGHLQEELDEFHKACLEGRVEEAVDGMIDLAYVALGRVLEMGASPSVCFSEVHRANMRKRRGAVSKRKFAKGYDAVKPEGWAPPDLQRYLVPAHVLDMAISIQNAAPSVPGGAEALTQRMIENRERGQYIGLDRKDETIIVAQQQGAGVFKKNDSTKVSRPELVPAPLTIEEGKLYAKGALKYDAENWRLGADWSRYVGAMERHFLDWRLGIEYDMGTPEEPGTGIHNLIAARWSLGVLYMMWLCGLGNDDRPDKGLYDSACHIPLKAVVHDRS